MAELYAVDVEYDDLYQGDGFIGCHRCGEVFEEEKGFYISPAVDCLPLCPECGREYTKFIKRRRTA